MTARVRDVDAGSLERAAQLTQKTNQFNLTLVRRTIEEVRRLADDPGFIFDARAGRPLQSTRDRRVGDRDPLGAGAVTYW